MCCCYVCVVWCLPLHFWIKLYDTITPNRKVGIFFARTPRPDPESEMVDIVWLNRMTEVWEAKQFSLSACAGSRGENPLTND